MKKSLLIFMLSAIILSPISFGTSGRRITNHASAATTVGSRISSDTVWTVAGSPYLVYMNDVIVDTGVTLTIEPGAVVKLIEKSLIVRGNLTAHGTSDNHILFTSLNDNSLMGKSVDWSSGNPQAGDWNSIKSQGGGTIDMDQTEVRYGGQGYADLVRSNNRFFQIQSALAHDVYFDVGAVSCENSSVQINHTIISRNKIGIQIGPACQFDIADSRLFENFSFAAVNNITDGSATLNAKNNWWGDNSGPHNDISNPAGIGQEISGNIDFDPWTGKGEAPKKTPVIIVPGIMGSYLNRASDGGEVWPNVFMMLLPGDDSYLNELILQPDGSENVNSAVLAGDIMRKISSSDFFEGLIAELVDNGYKEGENLFVFPYDWRLDIAEIAGNTSSADVLTFKYKIDQVKRITESEKVDVIAHSMGGLIVKKYIYDNGYESIDKFIDVATPHLGAPKVSKVLNYGDSMDMNKFGLGLNPLEVKSIAQNFPSIYQLLPSPSYFDESDNRFYIYDALNNLGELSYDQSIEFLRSSGRNSSLLDNAINIHDDTDNMTISNSYNIVGCGQPTIGSIRILKDSKGKETYKLTYINGDGTVPFRSADWLQTDKKFYASMAEHASLPSAPGIKQLVTSILKENSDEFDFSPYPRLDTNTSHCLINGKLLGIHSPVALNIYDEAGNHAGPNENGDIEMNIPGVAYDIIGDNKFVFLPAGQDYTVIGQATDEGEFSLDIQNVIDDDYKDTVYWNDVAIPSTDMSIQLNISAEESIGSIEISKDNNSDGVIDETLNSDYLLGGEEAGDLEAPQTRMSVNGGEANDGDEFSTPITFEFLAEDDLSGVLKTEYAVNGTSSWQTYDQENIPDIDVPGEYTIYYFSTDRAGNREEIKSVMISVQENDCVVGLKNLVNDLYAQRKIKKIAVKNLLLFELETIEKLVQKYVSYDKAVPKLLEAAVKLIRTELNLYARLGWITNEASGIIKERLQCVYNYLH